MPSMTASACIAHGVCVWLCAGVLVAGAHANDVSGSAPPSTTPAAKPKPTEDLDELTRRFEALKRG